MKNAKNATVKTTEYFGNVSTCEDVKALYIKYAKKLNPESKEFAEMSAQYVKVYNKFREIHKTMQGKEYRKAAEQTAIQFADMISAVVYLDGISLSVKGTWIIANGDTKPVHTELRKAGFWFSRNGYWYFKDGLPKVDPSKYEKKSSRKTVETHEKSTETHEKSTETHEKSSKKSTAKSKMEQVA